MTDLRREALDLAIAPMKPYNHHGNPEFLRCTGEVACDRKPAVAAIEDLDDPNDPPYRGKAYCEKHWPTPETSPFYPRSPLEAEPTMTACKTCDRLEKTPSDAPAEGKPRWRSVGVSIFDGDREALYVSLPTGDKWTERRFKHRARLAREIAELLNEASDDVDAKARPEVKPVYVAIPSALVGFY